MNIVDIPSNAYINHEIKNDQSFRAIWAHVDPVRGEYNLPSELSIGDAELEIANHIKLGYDIILSAGKVVHRKLSGGVTHLNIANRMAEVVADYLPDQGTINMAKRSFGYYNSLIMRALGDIGTAVALCDLALAYCDEDWSSGGGGGVATAKGTFMGDPGKDMLLSYREELLGGRDISVPDLDITPGRGSWKFKLHEAIANENYEEAAQLRDKIGNGVTEGMLYPVVRGEKCLLTAGTSLFLAKHFGGPGRVFEEIDNGYQIGYGDDVIRVRRDSVIEANDELKRAIRLGMFCREYVVGFPLHAYAFQQPSKN